MNNAPLDDRSAGRCIIVSESLNDEGPPRMPSRRRCGSSEYRASIGFITDDVSEDAWEMFRSRSWGHRRRADGCGDGDGPLDDQAAGRITKRTPVTWNGFGTTRFQGRLTM